MHGIRVCAAAFVAALALVPLTIPADAASTRPTARATGALDVYDQEYGPFRHIIFQLANGERVYVLDCTRGARRCEIQTLDGRHEGWVDGTYLVGAAAKNAVSPPDFSFDPMDPLGFFHHHP